MEYLNNLSKPRLVAPVKFNRPRPLVLTPKGNEGTAEPEEAPKEVSLPTMAPNKINFEETVKVYGS